MISGDVNSDSLPKSVEGCEIENGVDIAPFAAVHDCVIGQDTRIWRFTNLYGCEIGADSMIGSFVEIQSDVVIGDRTRVQSHAFVCSLTTIEENVFVGHGAKFINDVRPPSDDPDEWEPIVVEEGAVIGTNATILPVTIGENALVGAGAVVTSDVPPNAIVAGNPAEIVSYRE